MILNCIVLNTLFFLHNSPASGPLYIYLCPLPESFCQAPSHASLKILRDHSDSPDFVTLHYTQHTFFFPLYRTGHIIKKSLVIFLHVEFPGRFKVTALTTWTVSNLEC